MKLKKLIFAVLLLITAGVYGQTQFDIGVEIRPRFESRNGYKILPIADQDAANFVSQRTRLTFGYSQDKLKLKVAINNVKVWGDIKTLGADDVNISFHEAWAEALLSDKFSIRLGRQEIVYDDHRIFGNVNWTQQGRSHDAMVMKWVMDAKNRLDIGFALNANGESLARTAYTMQYKALQYAWYHGNFNKFGLSFLLLNNGIEYDDSGSLEVDYSQTFGIRLTYKEGKFNADASFYLQGGKHVNKDVSTSNYAINLKYKVSPEFLIGVGYEYLSGNDIGDTSEINAFSPLYGTNHKFNGWMDYFYVGNWGNNVGLKDLNFVLAYSKDKFSAKVIPYFFTAAADTGAMDDKLGTEIDFTIGYKIAKNTNFMLGYSHMSGKDTLVALQGGNRENNGNWAWVQFVFNPTLFSFKK